MPLPLGGDTRKITDIGFRYTEDYGCKIAWEAELLSGRLFQ